MDVFDASADFSPLTDESTGMSIGQVEQTIVIEIDEDGQIEVLDVGDSCRMGISSGEAVSYDIEEYQAKRTEAEKTLQKNYKSWEEVEFGGSQLKKIITNNKTVFSIIAVVIVLAVVALIISLVAVSKKKKG